MNHKIIDKCRYCGSSKLILQLDLGEMPLVNNLLDTREQEDPLFPLKFYECGECRMHQIDCVVDPKVLYNNYRYRSGMSKEFKQHCADLAFKISEDENISLYPTIISIAENDGTFLQNFNEFNETYGEDHYTILGIEPATNLCKIMDKKKIPNINKFFSYQTALDIATKYDADFIVAQNVFAHVDDIYDFMHGICRLLKYNGTFIVEAPWSIKTICDGDIGQIYHEHLGYLSFNGMRTLMEKFNLFITDVEYFDIHGGTIRYYIRRKKNSNITKGWAMNGLSWKEITSSINRGEIPEILKNVRKLNDNLHKVINEKPVYGVGASAKGCILLNALSLGKYVEKIFDNTPEKIGKFQPGTKLPIVDFNEIKDLKDDIPFLILSHNWQEEIMKNVRKLKPDARFILTHPEVKMV